MVTPSNAPILIMVVLLVLHGCRLTAATCYYMRKSMAAGSCDFSGTATIAKTDPSYGSCVYPPSPSKAL
nr:plasmodesmata callose binding protein 3-like [Tanacetum cinerariifolium]